MEYVIDTIQLKRTDATKSEIAANINNKFGHSLEPGEPLYSISSKCLYIGEENTAICKLKPISSGVSTEIDDIDYSFDNGNLTITLEYTTDGSSSSNDVKIPLSQITEHIVDYILSDTDLKQALRDAIAPLPHVKVVSNKEAVADDGNIYFVTG